MAQRQRANRPSMVRGWIFWRASNSGGGGLVALERPGFSRWPLRPGFFGWVGMQNLLGRHRRAPWHVWNVKKRNYCGFALGKTAADGVVWCASESSAPALWGGAGAAESMANDKENAPISRVNTRFYPK